MTFPDNFDLLGQYENIELMTNIKKLRLGNYQHFLEAILKQKYLQYKKTNKPDITFEEFLEILQREIEKDQKSKSTPKNLQKSNPNLTLILFQLKSMKPH